VSWGPPTTNADGTTLIGSTLTPVSAPLTYLIYAQAAATPVPVPGTTIPTLTLAPPAAGGNAAPSFLVSALPAGLNNLWVAASSINGVSVVPAAPLLLGAAPSMPSGVTVR
jgi:hypothetical protein